MTGGSIAARQQLAPATCRKQIAPLSGAICGAKESRFVIELRKGIESLPDSIPEMISCGSNWHRQLAGNKLRRCPAQFVVQREVSSFSNRGKELSRFLTQFLGRSGAAAIDRRFYRHAAASCCGTVPQDSGRVRPSAAAKSGASFSMLSRSIVTPRAKAGPLRIIGGCGPRSGMWP